MIKKALSIFLSISIVVLNIRNIHANASKIENKINKKILSILSLRPDLIYTMKKYLQITERLNGIEKQIIPLIKVKNTENELIKTITKIIESDNAQALQEYLPGDLQRLMIECDLSLGDHTASVVIPIMYYAITIGSRQCFSFLLSIKCDPTAKVFICDFDLSSQISTSGLTLQFDSMAFAVMAGRWDILKFLEEKGLSKISNPGVWTAACLTYRNEFLKTLIRKLSIEKMLAKTFSNILFWGLYGAIIGNNLFALNLLVSRGGNINTTRDQNGNTLLHCAAVHNRHNMAKLLIKMGARIDSQNIKFYTPLHLASIHNSCKVAKLLIENDADINLINTDHNSPLHFCSLYNNPEIAKLLIKGGEKIDVKRCFGNPPSEITVHGNWFEIGNLLILRGLCIDLENKMEMTALHLAAKSNSLEIAKLLIKNGARIFVQDQNGNTPLHLASKYNSFDVAKLLVSKGLEFNDIKDLSDFENNLIINFLATQESDYVNVKNYDGLRSIDYAEDPQILSLLSNPETAKS